jgi:cell division septation protein DedD
MAREGRFGMGIGDRLVLLAAWIATCGFVYLLGFYLGKGTQERRLGVEERIVRLPITSQPPPEGQRPRSENEFVFYDKLMGERGPERPSEVRGPARPAAPPAAAPASASAPEATTRPAPAAAGQAARPTPAVGVATAKPASAPKPAASVPERPSRVSADLPDKLPAPAAPATVAARPAASPAMPPPIASPAAGGWTVLANPTRSRDEADGLFRQLRGRGYEATLVRVVRDGDTWYRVQIGRFPTSAEATEMMHRLREREGVSHVFVASE